jgi:eukaryotic-like serine/threonine-protein kinase
MAALAATALVAATGVWYGRQASGGPAGSRTAVDPPVFQRLTFEEARIEAARFAPDGRTVVYSQRTGGTRRMLLTRLEFPGATALPIEDGLVMAVSSNAELAFATNHRGPQDVKEGTLARVPLLGGAPRPVVDGVNYADWSPAGELAIVRVVGSQQRLEFPVGTVLFQTEGEIDWPRVSPDGQHVAFSRLADQERRPRDARHRRSKGRASCRVPAVGERARSRLGPLW